MPTDHEFVTPTEKTQCQVHLTSEKVQGDLQQFSHTRESRVKNHVPTEKVFPWHMTAVRGENEAQCRLSEWENAARLALEEQRDHLLAEAKSEVLKQECRTDVIGCCICELQRQIHSIVWKLNMQIMDMKNLEESSPGFTKSWRNERKHFEKLTLEVFMKWKN